MSKHKLSVSIVIPVYNEEDHIEACLQSIARQTVKPSEVILVDNNSTDNTMVLAAQYPFVTILKETRQSQVYAQKTGFEHARGDVIGRLDADAILPSNWVERVSDAFNNDPQLVGLTGGARAYDVPLGRAGTWIFTLYHEILSSFAAGHVMLWGSNCAVRGNALNQVQNSLLERADIWEDYDLSFLLAKKGKIQRLASLKVGNSFRAAHKPPLTQARYQLRSIRTFWLRAVWWRAILFTFFWATLPLIYPIPLIDGLLLKFKQNPKRDVLK